MKLNEFDVIRRYVQEACLFCNAETFNFSVSENSATFQIDNLVTKAPSGMLAAKVGAHFVSEMHRRGWNVVTEASVKGNLTVEFKRYGQ